MQISLNENNSFMSAANSGARFVPLGRSDQGIVSDADADFIQRRQTTRGPDIWATLGPWKDSGALALRGTLLFSAEGSRHSIAEYSGQATMQEIVNVREAREDGFNEEIETAVVERYISLEETKLAPRVTGERFARLTVFVRPDEGALVFLQRMSQGSGRGKKRLAKPEETDIEYLLPEATDCNNSCHQRDRLNYRVPLYPAADLDLVAANAKSPRVKPVRDSGRKQVIKVLVFKRRNSTSHDVIRRALQRIGGARHSLLRYRSDSSCFEEIGAERLDRGARTLLLLHGTFSSTVGTFGRVYSKPDNLFSTLLSHGKFE